MRAVQTKGHVQFARDRRLRGDGTSSVELPQNWATPTLQIGDDMHVQDDEGTSAGFSELEKENDALRKNLELLEENASLRRRIDELAMA